MYLQASGEARRDLFELPSAAVGAEVAVLWIHLTAFCALFVGHWIASFFYDEFGRGSQLDTASGQVLAVDLGHVREGRVDELGAPRLQDLA